MAGALQARFLWLLVPAVGLLELAAQAWVSTRAPDLEDWRAVTSTVLSKKRPGEPLVLAPDDPHTTTDQPGPTQRTCTGSAAPVGFKDTDQPLAPSTWETRTVKLEVVMETTFAM